MLVDSWGDHIKSLKRPLFIFHLQKSSRYIKPSCVINVTTCSRRASLQKNQKFHGKTFKNNSSCSFEPNLKAIMEARCKLIPDRSINFITNIEIRRGSCSSPSSYSFLERNLRLPRIYLLLRTESPDICDKIARHLSYRTSKRILFRAPTSERDRKVSVHQVMRTNLSEVKPHKVPGENQDNNEREVTQNTAKNIKTIKNLSWPV